MKKKILLVFVLFTIMISCNNSQPASDAKIHLITLDPGHFHAALVQKTMYDDVDSVVNVYAPEGNDLKMHLDRIAGYNARSENPAHWKEEVFSGNDFFEKMISEKKGNTVVLSGNNQKKTEYILQSLENGLNVLADKPMVIDSRGFDQLKKAFDVAAKNKLLLYDIMTERYEITTMLQRELSQLPGIFGTLEKGSPDNPSITKESVHHFYKYVSGSVLTRPAWFLDVTQQGEGIVDVMTHLVDLVQWECFPDQVIDSSEINFNSARRWTTDLGLTEFKAITKMDEFPAYFKEKISNDTMLPVYCNGEINYTIKGVHAKTSVIWNYKAPDGTGDTHYSIMKGTKANLVIRQGAEEQYKPTLYIEMVVPADTVEVMNQFQSIQTKYPGAELKKNNKGWEVIIPEKYKEGHEAHFGRVMEKFLEYYKNKNMPAWEIPNMITKYYITTKALELALKK